MLSIRSDNDQSHIALPDNMYHSIINKQLNPSLCSAVFAINYLGPLVFFSLNAPKSAIPCNHLPKLEVEREAERLPKIV